MKFGLAVIDVQSNLTFPDERTLLRRRNGRSAISFKFVQWYRPKGISADTNQRAFDITTTSWEYAIHDADHHEIVAYHWHPDGVSRSTSPHFHLGSAIIDTTGHEMGKTFSRLHLPSGIITIAEVVRALIEEFDVQPIHNRWDETLRACQEAIERQRTNS